MLAKIYPLDDGVSSARLMARIKSGCRSRLNCASQNIPSPTASRIYWPKCESFPGACIRIAPSGLHNAAQEHSVVHPRFRRHTLFQPGFSVPSLSCSSNQFSLRFVTGSLYKRSPCLYPREGYHTRSSLLINLKRTLDASLSSHQHKSHMLTALV